MELDYELCIRDI